MIGSLQSRSGWRGRCLSLLLSFSLALSLIGPVTGLPAKEGYIPVCTGSEIIYIPLGATVPDQPAEDRPAPIFESCPWSALAQAIAAGPVTAAPGAVVYLRVPALPAGHRVSSQHISGPFQARAPPRRDADDSRDS